MTIEGTKEAIKVMQAYIDGKTVQYREKGTDDEWIDMSIGAGNTLIGWYFSENDYRIAPEPTYRPYKNATEFVKAAKEHGPYLRNKDCEDKYELATNPCPDKLMFGDTPDNYEYIFENDVWQDNTPCGVLINNND